MDVVIGTSSFLREHSHGKDIQWILKVSEHSQGCLAPPMALGDSLELTSPLPLPLLLLHRPLSKSFNSSRTKVSKFDSPPKTLSVQTSSTSSACTRLSTRSASTASALRTLLVVPAQDKSTISSELSEASCLATLNATSTTTLAPVSGEWKVHLRVSSFRC